VKLDSRAISIKGRFIDPENLQRNTSGCILDSAKMKYDPIKIVFSHLDKQTTMRKLSWHADELKTNIEMRKCVVWNKDLGVHGAWDDRSCTTVITEQTQTVCECGEFGTFAVIAELIESPHVEPERKWLKFIKYIGMGLSIPALLIFIAIIAFSKYVHAYDHIWNLE
jgi:hypothetical protein